MKVKIVIDDPLEIEISTETLRSLVGSYLDIDWEPLEAFKAAVEQKVQEHMFSLSYHWEKIPKNENAGEKGETS